MTFQTITALQSNSSNTTFRTWGSAVNAALAASGTLTQTSDTGQINWTTVTVPASTNTVAGYEIWKFNDSYTSTSPIYIRMNYGTYGTTATTWSGMSFQTGTGTDGAGTITTAFYPGIATAYQSIGTSASPQVWCSSVAATSTSYMASDANGFLLLMWPSYASSSSQASVLCIERCRNWDGTGNGDGYNVFYGYASNANVNGIYQVPISYLPNGYTGSGTSWNQTPIAYQPGGSGGWGGTVNYGNTLYPVPLFTGFNVRLGAPSKYLMGIGQGDLGGGATTTFTHYGTSVTWTSLGMGYTSSGAGYGTIVGGHRSLLWRAS